MRLTSMMVAMALMLAGAAGAQPPGNVVATLEYVVIDATTSTIGLTPDGTGWRVTIRTNYNCNGDQTLTCLVYDENTGKYETNWKNPRKVNGAGTMTLTYDVPANSLWGVAIANRTFDQCFVTVDMTSATNANGLNDNRYVYGPDR